MDIKNMPDNPYLLLTPGPLSTTKTVKEAMLRDWCTWDDSYNRIVQEIRQRLVGLATSQIQDYTAVLMQGSGTFAVEAVIGSVIPGAGKLLVVANGAYGRRLAQIATLLRIDTVIHDDGDVLPPDLEKLRNRLEADDKISHVAVVHCETTTGMLNPIESIGDIVNEFGRTYIVDAMSSFGGIPLDVADTGIDFLISSANKCIQGVPGFGFVVAKTRQLTQCGGIARSLSLDLYDQWREMEQGNGKWRFTSPTHVVHAFLQALRELDEEGGIPMRFDRYKRNQQLLAAGMIRLGFVPLLSLRYQSPIITTFHYPKNSRFSFTQFYQLLKEQGFVIYPGKLTDAEVFRIGNIGDIHAPDILGLLQAVEKCMYWLDLGKISSNANAGELGFGG
jgi:2-aminoethylphosphonate-pyruvate transaminase